MSDFRAEGTNELNDRISKALEMAEVGAFDGAHHKMWVIDQMVRILCGSEEAYEKWVSDFRGEYVEYESGFGEYEYEWDEGIAP